MNTFSIIIPHRNIPELLQRCLDSIPDVPEVQVIVVDDNSSSDKVDFNTFPGLTRQYTQCIFDKEGGGAGHARNIGLRHADGKWLVFADADDFFTKDAFHILEKHKNSPASIILFKADSVDSDTYAPSDRFQELNLAIDDVLSGQITPKEAVLSKPGPVCKMFRRDYIQSKHLTFDETKVANDQMFVTKATCWAENAAVQVSDEVLYTVTTRRGSLMDGRWKHPDNFLCRTDVQIRCNKFLKDYPQYRKEPIIILLARSHKFGFKTFLKTLKLVLGKRALFSGFGTFMQIVNNHTLKL